MGECRHLVYDRRKLGIDDRIELVDNGQYQYWRRPDRIANGGAVNVQYCELRGRLNDELACIGRMSAECEKYNPKG